MVVHVINGTISDEERDAYIGMAREKYGEACQQLDISVDGDWADLHYHIVGFERIRRITGYLVGTIDRWNDAKREELGDRVKHAAI